MPKKSYKKRGNYKVIVFDDNLNTFHHVRKSLQEICGHNYLQAIQCTSIIHNSGRCSVYTDGHDQCIEVFNELAERGLRASIVK